VNLADEIKLPPNLLIPQRPGDAEVEVTVSFRAVVPVPDDPSVAHSLPLAGFLADARIVNIYANPVVNLADYEDC